MIHSKNGVRSEYDDTAIFLRQRAQTQLQAYSPQTQRKLNDSTDVALTDYEKRHTKLSEISSNESPKIINKSVTKFESSYKKRLPIFSPLEPLNFTRPLRECSKKDLPKLNDPNRSPEKLKIIQPSQAKINPNILAYQSCLLQIRNQLSGNQFAMVFQTAKQYWQMIDTQGDIAQTLIEMLPINISKELRQIFIVEKYLLAILFDKMKESYYRDIFCIYHLCLEQIQNMVNLRLQKRSHIVPHMQRRGLKERIFSRRDEQHQIDNCLINLQTLLPQLIKEMQVLHLHYNSNKTDYLDDWFLTLDMYSTSDTYFDLYTKFRNVFSLWLYEREDALYLSLPKNLRTPLPPYLPSLSEDKPILVVDLDETLVHYKRGQSIEEKNSLLIRNHAQQFLETLSQFYQLIIWTASMPRYARWVIRKLKLNSNIELLTRQHCVLNDRNQFQKELSRLQNNCLQRTILVENDSRSSFEKEENYCLLIHSFTGENDQVLIDVETSLIQVAEQWTKGIDISKLLEAELAK